MKVLAYFVDRLNGFEDIAAYHSGLGSSLGKGDPLAFAVLDFLESLKATPEVILLRDHRMIDAVLKLATTTTNDRVLCACYRVLELAADARCAKGLAPIIRGGHKEDLECRRDALIAALRCDAPNIDADTLKTLSRRSFSDWPEVQRLVNDELNRRKPPTMG